MKIILKIIPPPTILPVIEKTKAAYREWQRAVTNLSKPFRFGLGAKIENSFIEILEGQFRAAFAKPEEKQKLLADALIRFDLLKFFLQISWENGYLKEKTYIHVSKGLNDIGKELAGWKRFIENKNSRL